MLWTNKALTNPRTRKYREIVMERPLRLLHLLLENLLPQGTHLLPQGTLLLRQGTLLLQERLLCRHIYQVSRRTSMRNLIVWLYPRNEKRGIGR